MTNNVPAVAQGRALAPVLPVFRLRDEATNRPVMFKLKQSVALFEHRCPCCGDPVETLLDGQTVIDGDWEGPSLMCKPCEREYAKGEPIDRIANTRAAAEANAEAAQAKRIELIYKKRLLDLRLAWRRGRIADMRESVEKLNAWRQSYQPEWVPPPDKWPEDQESEPLPEVTTPVFDDATESAIAGMSPDDRKKAIQAEWRNRTTLESNEAKRFEKHAADVQREAAELSKPLPLTPAEKAKRRKELLKAQGLNSQGKPYATAEQKSAIKKAYWEAWRAKKAMTVEAAADE